MEEEVKKEESMNNEEYLKLKRSNNKKTTIIIILVFIVILMLLLIVLYYINGNRKEEKGEDNPTPTPTQKSSYENTFKYSDDGSYGVAYVTGYAKVIKEANCGDAECPEDEEKDDALYFYITSTESKDVKKYLDSFHGDGYDGETYFRVGCLKDDIISYYNAADAWYDSNNTSAEISTRYNKTFTLDKNVTTKLLNSNINNSITLRLEKLKLSYGGEAFSCYSHFSGIEIVD